MENLQEEQELSGEPTFCNGVAMPSPQDPNGHWECESTGWVWYDDIGE